jgi:molybdenum cofactor cytidylyltransferase
MPVYAVVLAAGRSRRMGTQKLVLPFAGKTVIGHVVDQILNAPVAGVVVVVGPEHHAIAEALSSRPVTLVVNAEAEAEMLSSVRVGLQTLPSDAQAALVVLGDQPSIETTVIEALLQTFSAAGKGIVIPTCDNRRGHPLLVSARYFDEIAQGYDGGGLRELITAHPNDLQEVAVSNSGVLFDIDYPADYQREIQRHAARDQEH